MSFKYIEVTDNFKKDIALVRLNRPKDLNALSLEMMMEIRDAMLKLDSNPEVKVIILTGNEKAFAAGADIKQMSGRNSIDMLKVDQFTIWDQIRQTKKPLIAAVSGFALGGGCELAMLCDMIVASESAKFGQPEIKIGVMPGAGGTQRLTRAVGKARAMEMVLTGKFISAEEAFNYGLVNKVVPVELYLTETVRLAEEVAKHAPVSVQLAKEAVNQAFNTFLDQGLLLERKNFYALFSTEDQKEGMQAFIEKRKPDFKGK
ncbi:MAG: enoyl-CoA hydratase [Chitinophagaceae bacterium]|nr:MAG: enoyl-CoA hydratase [Chitinophagaceae bacterium]